MEPLRVTFDRMRRQIARAMKLPMRVIGSPIGAGNRLLPPAEGRLVLRSHEREAVLGRLKRERRFPHLYRQFNPKRRRRSMAGK